MKTVSEQLFEKYLEAFSYEWEYEPDSGLNKKPDYLITIQGKQFYFEIKQFDTNPLLEEARKNPGKVVGGFIDQYKPIRTKIEQARIKFKEYKDYPCILVLYDNNSFKDLTNLTISGAMYGNIDVSWIVPIKDNGKAELSGMHYADGGKMRRKKENQEIIQNTTISAIAIMEHSQTNDMVKFRTIHNYFASKPVQSNIIFTSQDDEHFISKDNGNLEKVVN